LGISESLLPANSIVLFRAPTIWEQYRWRLILAFAAVGLQSALIFGLVYEDRRRRTAEDDAHSLLVQLERRNRFAAAGELTASIAHEIRQPLTSIVVAAQAGLNWLKNEVPDLQEARSSLNNIVKEGHRADDVIRNVRAMFSNDRQEQGTIDVNALIEGVLALAARTLQNNDVRVKTVYAPKTIVRGNSVQLQQVLMNLINNAVEAMSACASNDRLLQLKTEFLGSGDRVSLAVQDSGPGIDLERRSDLFKPLFSTKPGGMGLGLSICKSVIDAHGGSLSVTAGNPVGAVFTIILPLEREVT
jgi:signal transduction histidine kinase